MKLFNIYLKKILIELYLFIEIITKKKHQITYLFLLEGIVLITPL